nr:prepilin-type N-terminal cleavage/methylation domain-containing protein [uncultured Massilia sp.]
MIDMPAKRTQAGFTLVELLAVVTVVGVLAATALPAYADLQSDARVAVLRSAGASLAAVAHTVHAKGLVDPRSRGDGTNLRLESATVTVRNGYPAADEGLAAAAGLAGEDGQAGWQVDSGGGKLVVAPAGVHAVDRCNVTYVQAAAAGAAPAITVTTADCS